VPVVNFDTGFLIKRLSEMPILKQRSIIPEYLHRLPKSLLISIGFVIVALVGIINYLAGPELSTWIFYFIPIFLVTWFTYRWVGMIMSIVSALMWFLVDITSGVTYSYSTIPYWNGIARFCSFLIFTFILSVLKTVLEHEKELSRIDFLTGVGNRRYFTEVAEMEINRARRYKHPFTVVYVDLDNFKTINDHFGHSKGDNLLCLIASTIQNNIRITDTVARLGGDEFAILFPESGPELAEVIICRLKRINLEIMQKHELPVTFSIGVVTFTSPPSSVDEMLKISDNHMYVAKSNGKNTIKHAVFGTAELSPMTAAW
jgi:diguanylate cyclase (GGDEF)-like protein